MVYGFKVRLLQPGSISRRCPIPTPIPFTLIVPSRQGSKMVNYDNPVTIAQELGTCAFPSGFRGWQPN